jgi:hypothetical protein
MSSSKFSGPFMQKSALTPLQGNAFIKAKMDAEAAGKSSFSVDGKNYPLKMEESPLGNHHPPVDVKALEKRRNQREDSIFKDIGGRKGMKAMQVKMENGTATKEEIAAFRKAVQDYKNKKKKK